MKTPLILAVAALIAVGCDQRKESTDTSSLKQSEDNIQKSAKDAKSEIEKEARVKKEIVEAEAKSAQAQIDAEKARAKATTVDAQSKLEAATQTIRDAGAAGARAVSEIGASKNTVPAPTLPSAEPAATPAIPTPVASTAETDQRLVDQVRSVVLPVGGEVNAASAVQVTAAGGIVTLKGSVKTETEKTRMETAAKAISGVTKVDNQIEVKE